MKQQAINRVKCTKFLRTPNTKSWWIEIEELKKQKNKFEEEQKKEIFNFLKEYENRNWFHKILDKIFGEDPLIIGLRLKLNNLCPSPKNN